MQLSIDFSNRLFALDGKKTERLTIPCCSTFKIWLQQIAKARNMTVAEILYEYSVTGMQKDLGLILMISGNSDKPLKDFVS